MDSTVALSRERVKITQGKYGFGATSKLELLQAQLDLNADRADSLRQFLGPDVNSGQTLPGGGAIVRVQLQSGRIPSGIPSHQRSRGRELRRQRGYEPVRWVHLRDDWRAAKRSITKADLQYQEARAAQEKFVAAESRLVSARFESNRAETELLLLADGLASRAGRRPLKSPATDANGNGG